MNKLFYEKIGARMQVRLEMPRINLVLEANRREIHVGFWRDNQRECGHRKLFEIGDGEGKISAADLGFSEIYFQYFIQTDVREFLAFPLAQEALLEKGYFVRFDSNWSFKESVEMPAKLGENTMRPTACLLNRDGKQLLMLGGRQDRSSQIYSFKEQSWKLTPKLPLGHNVTTNITVNWKDKAVFTFIVDAQMTIKSAVMDLEKAVYTAPDTENTQEMAWALKGDQGWTCE